jgi:transcription elongation GreA/GreB family factor
MSSPIGRTLLGKAVGDKFVLRLPATTRHLKLIELQTIHDDVAAS